jgi:hypothetical protein
VVEGTPLLREHTGQNLYPGFESLRLRHTSPSHTLSVRYRAQGRRPAPAGRATMPHAPRTLLLSLPRRADRQVEACALRRRAARHRRALRRVRDHWAGGDSVRRREHVPSMVAIGPTPQEGSSRRRAANQGSSTTGAAGGRSAWRRPGDARRLRALSAARVSAPVRHLLRQAPQDRLNERGPCWREIGYCLRREKPSPARPRPSSGSVAGSGTACYIARTPFCGSRRSVSAFTTP